MKIIFFLICSVLLLNQQMIDRKAYYAVLSGNSAKDIEQTIIELEKGKSSSLGNAYLGGLYMKKASFLQKPKEKLETFNKGKALLENEIKQQPRNTEYRFIRLILQENSPKILKYNSNIRDDKEIIIKNFQTLNTDLKKIIIEYSNTSTIIHPEELR